MLLLPAVIGNLFYFWVGVAVLLAVWIWMSFHAMQKYGKFVIMMGGAHSGDTAGSTRRALYIFSAVRAAVIVLCIVLALLQIHSRHH
jgi:hypothetical protein